MNYDLKKPCANCPFRLDPFFYLHPDRVREIAASLRNNGTFSCHKTVDYSDDEPSNTRKTQHCAGALLVMRSENTLWDNQMVRIVANLQNRDFDIYLEDDIPVYACFEDYARLLEEADGPRRHIERPAGSRPAR